MKKFASIILVSLFAINAYSQIAIGQWRDHLPYKKGMAVTEGGGYVYCATEDAVFTLNKADNTFEKLSKVSGLSDVGVSDVKYNNYNGVVLVSYTNGNLDLIENKSIYNISDIKRSGIVANKRINSIYYLGKYAYLACGFGIVKFDTDRKEVSDTYYIGTNGGYIDILDITTDNNFIYAATDSGVYRASFSAPNLADYTAWSKITVSPAAPAGCYNTICAFNGKIYANYSRYLTSNQTVVQKDTVFVYDGISWNNMDTSGYVCRSIETIGNYLVITYNGYVTTYDNLSAVVGLVGSYQTQFYVDPSQAVRDSDGYLWIADRANGLIKNWDSWSNWRYAPDGPETNKVYNLDIVNETMWVAPGERTDIWLGQYNFDGAFYFENEDWSVYNYTTNSELNSVRDIVDATIDPNNIDHVYLGCLGRGLIEMNGGVVTEIWNDSNSSLEVRADAPTSGFVGIFGSAFDDSGNLWVTNTLATNPLSVRKEDGTWQSFNFGTLINVLALGQIVVTKEGQKWIVLPRGQGILVFDENDTWTTTDDSYKKLSTAAGQGGLPSNEVYSLQVDEDGEIWVGTDAGIAVFYSPEDIFSNNPSDAQQILIQQDGHTQILLETEAITWIAIDGANRKWIGTQGSGVYLMSPDGTKEIYHFNENNSPLFSNNITSIAINGKSGEVFIGTAKGIISYKSTATEGEDEFGEVYAYPNPVRPGYGGIIAIKGLVKDADVKITDITGTLIYQTKALGGQAIWDGNNFSGERARSGIYLVFCSNDDGTKTYVTKICIVN